MPFAKPILSATVVAITVVSCRPSAQPDAPQPLLVVSNKLGSDLDRFLTSASGLGYSGVWLVEVGGRVILDKGYGYSDRESGTRFSSGSPIPLGSIPKQFTAAAILSLQDEGKLRTSDSIARFFPDAPADKRAITIHQLLTHTAGLPTYSGPDDELITRDTLVARMMRVKLRSTPGEKFAYSNPGYSLLAVIVELVTGIQFESYLRNVFFNPLRMTSTISEASRFDRDSLPVGYLGDRAMPRYRAGDGGRFSDGTLSWNLVGGAGFFSTTADMLRWSNAWKSGSILSDASRRMAVTRHTPWGSDTTRFYGYGWILDGPPHDRGEWHSGGDGVSAAYFNRYIDRDITTISFTNHSQGPSQLVLSSVRDALRGSVLPELPAAGLRLERAALEKFAGSYVLPSGDTVNLTVLNDQLVLPLSRRGAAAAATCFPPLKDSTRIRDIENRVERIFLALSRNDQRPALDAVWPGISLDEEREYWNTTWPDWIKDYGAFHGAELIGSVPGTSTMRPGVQLTDTFLFLRFAKGQYLITVKQDPDGKMYFDTSTTSLLQPRYYYVVQSTNTFETYNFRLRTRSPLTFVTNSSGDVSGATLGCSRMFARKV